MLEVEDLQPDGVPGMLASCRERGISKLQLRRAKLSDAQVVALLREPALAQLEHLQIELDRGSAEIWSAPAELSRALAALDLRRLVLWNFQLRDPGLTELAGSGALSKLESFSLAYEETTLADGLRALWQPSAAARLTRLVIGASRVDAKHMCGLLESPLAARLESLSLWDTPAGEFWEALCKASGCSHLHKIVADESDFGDAQARYFARHCALPALTHLNLGWNQLSPLSLLALLESRRLPGVRLQATSRRSLRCLEKRLGRHRDRFLDNPPHDCGTASWQENYHWDGWY